ncbi:NAD(P)-dependent alcohol dehydrogenase [Limisphaera ngatamarikiensis]|uniref:alcohol dehydrogenase (NADP(+)) n=1 Tax=Limisphaera ngatamarikiensis TaxID=1324935 RepID=A0A6M1RQM6_9BACT|nr:NAD(P)-dependent alcohol dehydrogenase [Limisphaera ngatamarikiensis]NGO39677.1 NAD(P)-dependent alcohol dehydrogenase [Limisphaera ngatamarikiensis]
MTQVEAYAALGPGQPLVPWSYEIQQLQPNEVLVRVRACGICHSDVHMIDNDWGFARYPLVPGHEVVGEVVAVGPLVTHLSPGMRVGIGWQRSSCGQCEDCLRGQDHLCDQSQGVITHGHGGFASHLAVDARYCFPLPNELPTEAAGPLLCGGITVYSALRAAGMGSGLRIGIIGMGGLGHMAIQFASRLGNHVTAFTTTEAKAREAAQLGAHDAILIRNDQPSRRPDRPLHIILNTAPVPTPVEPYLDLLASDGVLCYVGAPTAPISVPIFPLLVKRRRIMGSPIGSRATILEMLENAARFGVLPRVETFPMSKVNDALNRVRQNQVRYRAVLLA